MSLDRVLSPIGGIRKSIFSLLASVDVTTDIRQQVDHLINQMFDKLDNFTSDLKYAANELLVKSKQMADDLIDTTFNRLSAFREEVDNILKTIEQFTPENITNKLVDPFFARVDELRMNFINDVRTLVNEAVIQVVDGVEKIMYKGDLILTNPLLSLSDFCSEQKSDIVKVYQVI